MKLSLKNLLKKPTSKTYYADINECNVWAWFKFKEKKNYAYLNPANKNKSDKNIEKDYSNEGDLAFMNLLSEYFQTFGVSEEYKKKIELEIKLIKKNCEYCISGDRNVLNEINYIKNKIKAINDKQLGEVDPKRDLKDMGLVASKISRPFNNKEMSIFEYYTLLS